MNDERTFRVLVCIASYGFKNQIYLEKILNEYRKISFNVKIIVVSDQPRKLGSDVEIIIGLPSKNPYSLPFSHKKIFAERINEYDLFIYSEDDILIDEINIKTFLQLTDKLPENCISGFLRYEEDAYGKRYFPDALERFHWILNSIEKHGGEIFARFKNDHSAAYMLTNRQLRKAVDSGGYLVPPHEGEYQLRESAATDPYTKCGFRKLLCISLLPKILIHHLPNVYIGQYGIEFDELQKQIEALKALNNQSSELFFSRKSISFRYWDKWFYEDTDSIIIEALKGPNKNVLSIGAGWGRLEEDVKRLGHRVAAVSVDKVIEASLKYRNIDVIESNFNTFGSEMVGCKFDCVILSNVLQHLEDPEEILKKVIEIVSNDGIVISKVPNFNFFRWKKNRPKTYKDSKLTCIKIHWLSKWFQEKGFRIKVIPKGSERTNCLLNMTGKILASRLARSFVVIALRRA